MGIYWFRHYRVCCDWVGCPADLNVGLGPALDPDHAGKQAEAKGWLRRGTKFYCPACRPHCETLEGVFASPSPGREGGR